jgi:hypothetical protein
MARDPPPKYVLYGMIGVAVVAIIAILVVFLMSNRAPTNVANGGSCTSSKQCLSKYCNKTDPVNPQCDCAPDGTPCDSTVSCCGACNNGKCYTPDTSQWISVTGYNTSSHKTIDNINMSSDVCKSNCGDDDTCVAYSYFPTSNGCNYSTSLSSSIFDNNATSYIKKKTATLPGVFVGQGHQMISQINQSDCDTQCKTGVDGCVAYTFDSENSTCFLTKDFDNWTATQQNTYFTTYIL